MQHLFSNKTMQFIFKNRLLLARVTVKYSGTRFLDHSVA